MQVIAIYTVIIEYNVITPVLNIIELHMVRRD